MTDGTEWAGSASALFRTLSSETRLLILHHLMDGEKSTSELARLIGTSKTLLPQQLARLQRDNLVTSRRRDMVPYYALTSQQVPAMLEAAKGAFAR